jgi:uncharacterized protein YciI
LATFCLICWDKPGAQALRRENRDAHLAYLQATGNVCFAGPFLAEENGDTQQISGDMIGSLLVLEVADRAAAEQWAAHDPYHLAGLFQRVEIHPWKHVFGSLCET